MGGAGSGYHTVSLRGVDEGVGFLTVPDGFSRCAVLLAFTVALPAVLVPGKVLLLLLLAVVGVTSVGRLVSGGQ